VQTPPKLPIFVSAVRRERTLVSAMTFCSAALLAAGAACAAAGAAVVIWLPLVSAAAAVRALRPRSSRSRTRFH
jgi:hypothetical protein